MITVVFDFPIESDAGEIIWKMTADIIRENGRYWADITDARPRGESAGVYDLSDLEEALTDECNGRTIESVKQTAVDAFVQEETT